MKLCIRVADAVFGLIISWGQFTAIVKDSITYY
jgi:hypothetical protein